MSSSSDVPTLDITAGDIPLPPSAPSAHRASAPDDARRLCVELARQARDFHPDRDWPGIAPLLQRIWTREPREIAWDEARPLIHAAWMSRGC